MTTKPAKAIPPPKLSKFGPDAIDRAVSKSLAAAIPTGQDAALIDIKLTSADEEKLLTGVLAGNIDDAWGKVDIGGAVGGAIDLGGRRDWQVEVLVKASW